MGLGATFQEMIAERVSQARAMTPHAQYQGDPIGWAHDKLGIPEETIRWSLNEAYGSHVWDGDKDPLALIAEALVNWQDVGAESGTGTGKSFWVAVLILWFLGCFQNSQVFTFAPKEDQLRLYIWKNIRELWPRFSRHFPTATLTDLCIRMRGGLDESWAANGYAVGVKAGEAVSTKASGMHAEHLLLVYEEATDIAAAVMAAGKNTCVAPHNMRVAIGNPQNQLDTLHRFCQESGTVHVRISAIDHPNVVRRDPSFVRGAVSEKSIADRRRDYTEASPIYQSRVRGISPEQASDSLIRLEWLRRSAARYEARKALGTLPKVVTGKGVDAANSEHGDQAAIVDFADNVMVRCDAFPCPNSNKLGAQVLREIGGFGSLVEKLEPKRVGVDAIGVGAGTVNTLRDAGRMVQALYAGGSPMKMVERAPDGKTVEWTGDVNKFENLRGQMLWQARIDLQADVIDVPEDLELWEELVAVTFEDTGKVVKIPPKDEVKALLGRSPNKGDAFVMANWVRKRAIPRVKEEERGKQDNRAVSLLSRFKGGVVMPAERRRPKSATEVEEWLANRTAERRLPHRARTPRRSR